LQSAIDNTNGVIVWKSF